MFRFLSVGRSAISQWTLLTYPLCGSILTTAHSRSESLSYGILQFQFSLTLAQTQDGGTLHWLVIVLARGGPSSYVLGLTLKQATDRSICESLESESLVNHLRIIGRVGNQLP
jgi:hypothetical protein